MCAKEEVPDFIYLFILLASNFFTSTVHPHGYRYEHIAVSKIESLPLGANVLKEEAEYKV